MKSRGENRHGHNSCVHTAPECGYEFEAARIEKQRPFSRRGRRRQCGSNSAGARFQLRISEMELFSLSIGKIAERNARAVLRRSGAEHLDQIDKTCLLIR